MEELRAAKEMKEKSGRKCLASSYRCGGGDSLEKDGHQSADNFFFRKQRGIGGFLITQRSVLFRKSCALCSIWRRSCSKRNQDVHGICAGCSFEGATCWKSLQPVS